MMQERKWVSPSAFGRRLTEYNLHPESTIIQLMQRKKFRLPRKKIADFCKRWSITEFSLFGSVLRDDFRPDSDIDVLISIAPSAHISLFELARMQIELEKLFKRPVDLVEKESLRNPYRKQEILKTAQVIYASG